MKKLMIIGMLMCHSMVYSLTVVKKGVKPVKGKVTMFKDDRSSLRYVASFELQANGASFEPKSDQPATPASIDVSEQHFSLRHLGYSPETLKSPFTVVVIHADAEPITLSWHLDKDGAIEKEFEARKNKLEEEKNEQMKKTIDRALSA